MSDDTPTILIVDDEPSVRGVAAMHLQRRGYTILEATGGEDALKVLEGRSDVVLAIVDCNMPGMSGSELDKIILKRWPYIKIIAMSGRPPAHDLPDKVEFIHKPFRGADLVAKIESTLKL